MQRWEYCAINGVGVRKGEIDTYYPGIVHFTPEGARSTNLDGRGKDEAVAKRIAELGQQGWELVGVSLSDPPAYEGRPGWVTLFFKRPLP